MKKRISQEELQETILSILESESKYLSVQEIKKELEKIGIKRSPQIIKRNLEILKKKIKVEKWQ